jgi:hypothetical protein
MLPELSKMIIILGGAEVVREGGIGMVVARTGSVAWAAKGTAGQNARTNMKTGARLIF